MRADTGDSSPGDATMTMTSVDERKRLARRSLEMWASKDRIVPEEILAADYRNHQEPDAAGTVATLHLKGWKALVEEIHNAFSDFEVVVFNQLAEGDMVATRWQSTATNVGPLLGHPATGKRATWTGVQIDRFADGKIAESWVNWDKYRMFDELGYLGQRLSEQKR
jgi:predicted ester cyclase